jgi:hypothetical protein
MVTVNRRHRPYCSRPSGCGGQSRRSEGRRPRRPVAPKPIRVFFSIGNAQHVKRPTPGDWLAGAAMLLAAASWTFVAMLLGG